MPTLQVVGQFLIRTTLCKIKISLVPMFLLPFICVPAPSASENTFPPFNLMFPLSTTMLQASPVQPYRWNQPSLEMSSAFTLCILFQSFWILSYQQAKHHVEGGSLQSQCKVRKSDVLLFSYQQAWRHGAEYKREASSSWSGHVVESCLRLKCWAWGRSSGVLTREVSAHWGKIFF